MANEEDEWEKLEKLNLDEAAEKAVEQAAAFAAPNIPATKKQELPNVYFAGGSISGLPTANKESAPTNTTSTLEMVHPTLIEALRNPRERMPLLSVENNLVDFVKAQNRDFFELPPQANSFRRLLAYKLAYRFNLYHTTSDVQHYAQNGERGIRFSKTPTTKMPAVLLIDISSAELGAAAANIVTPPAAGGGHVGVDNASESGAENTTAATAVAPKKKFQLMKRAAPKTNASCGDDADAERNQKQQQSVEEREKAYEQARARIFGLEGGGEGEEGEEGTDGQAAATATAVEESGGGGVVAQPGVDIRPLDEGNVSPVTPTSPSTISAITTDTALKGKLRDIQAERKDPDFCRRGGGNIGYLSHNSNSYSNNNNNHNRKPNIRNMGYNNVSNSQQYYQQQVQQNPSHHHHQHQRHQYRNNNDYYNNNQQHYEYDNNNNNNNNNNSNNNHLVMMPPHMVMMMQAGSGAGAGHVLQPMPMAMHMPIPGMPPMMQMPMMPPGMPGMMQGMSSMAQMQQGGYGTGAVHMNHQQQHSFTSNGFSSYSSSSSSHHVSSSSSNNSNNNNNNNINMQQPVHNFQSRSAHATSTSKTLSDGSTEEHQHIYLQKQQGQVTGDGAPPRFEQQSYSASRAVPSSSSSSAAATAAAGPSSSTSQHQLMDGSEERNRREAADNDK